ncbi:hypothetical protein Ptr902_00901 [Pyrenophora tritici-repentis]|nr:hypothetical protein A1F99_019740 [Pyrenophora tritici-repentis]KAI1537280.1 hypothetical protein PtrSN001C_006197 [Pyrenophora tritici-repentis]KAI1575226.1 hypothetical protein PtrEW7m1_006594 [Pyrenophora tritici-repentis]KAI2486768.1 hypothetical protein Ptr902_00901 [Pyrenophora tritici-repentis]PWO24272.1 EntF, Non-ribosomal peptide synthetase [Pyrenophora tritici-repentis]
MELIEDFFVLRNMNWLFLLGVIHDVVVHVPLILFLGQEMFEAVGAESCACAFKVKTGEKFNVAWIVFLLPVQELGVLVRLVFAEIFLWAKEIFFVEFFFRPGNRTAWTQYVPQCDNVFYFKILPATIYTFPGDIIRIVLLRQVKLSLMYSQAGKTRQNILD